MSASFATTRWTLVLAAGNQDARNQESDTSARRALSDLFCIYRPPLLAHACRGGLSPADADDAVQGFFERLLRLDSMAEVRREHGRFRSFLLASFKHYLSDFRDRDHAQKRDNRLLVPLAPAADSVTYCVTLPSPDLPPDQAFDRAWALALLDAVVKRLRADYTTSGRLPLFDALAPTLSIRGNTQPMAAIAARLNMTEASARVAAHRLRQRYRQLLRDEIANTLARPGDIDSELSHLLSALRS